MSILVKKTFVVVYHVLYDGLLVFLFDWVEALRPCQQVYSNAGRFPGLNK